MGKLIQKPAARSLCVVLLLRSFCLLAQAAGPATTGQPAAEPAPPPIEPSRYAAATLDEYLKTIAGILHAPSRVTDPFGLLQDPDSKPIVPKTVRTIVPAEPVVPFSEIVPLIRITTIVAQQKKFLVENREFTQGEEFPLNFRGKQLRILITEVSANLDLLPPGMSAGGAGSTPPGMVPTGADAPLIIEP
jgi:hypothetical protein